jgi:hypothetical protein
MRATATPRFARELLDHPPHITSAAGRALPLASLSRLSIAFLSRAPNRALVSGTAARPAGPEEFAFLFEQQRDRWRAFGPAE